MHKRNHFPKRWKTTLRLAVFGGFLGLHRFYVGKTASAFLYLYTLGVFGAGWICDIIMILLNRFTDDQGRLIIKAGSAHLDAVEDKLTKKNRRVLERIGAGLILLGGVLTLSVLVPVLALFRTELWNKLGIAGCIGSIVMGLAGLAVIKIGTMFIQECFAFYTPGNEQANQTQFISRDSELYAADAIDGMNGHEFEHFCASLLRKNDFVDIEVTRGSGDQGVDILAKKDGIKYAIQCKSYSSKLGNTPVQQVSAGRMFYKCQIGAVMTNSTFTAGAEELAEATGTLLWDRRMLQEMMRK